jgi:hypothetical protein
VNPASSVFCRDAATRNRCEQLVPIAQFFRKISRWNATNVNAAAVPRGLSLVWSTAVPVRRRRGRRGPVPGPLRDPF